MASLVDDASVRAAKRCAADDCVGERPAKRNEIIWVVLPESDEDTSWKDNLCEIIGRMTVSYEDGRLTIAFSEQDIALVPSYIVEAIAAITVEDVERMMAITHWSVADFSDKWPFDDELKQMDLHDVFEMLTAQRFDVEFEPCPWEKERLLYEAVRDGDYERAWAFAESPGEKQRVLTLQIIELAAEPFRGKTVCLGDDGVLYRGMHFSDQTHQRNFLLDVHPWCPFYDSGKNRGKPKDPTAQMGLTGGETQFGMYTTLSHEQAVAYMRSDPSRKIGCVVRFSWRVLRALYAVGDVRFENETNDVFYATDSLCDGDGCHELIEEVETIVEKSLPVILPGVDTSEFMELLVGNPLDSAQDRIQNSTAGTLFAALRGRNRELVVQGRTSDYPMQGFNWCSKFSREDAVVFSVDWKI